MNRQGQPDPLLMCRIWFNGTEGTVPTAGSHALLAGRSDNGLTERFRKLLYGLRNDLRMLDERIAELDREITHIAASDSVARRLQQLRGVGPLIATLVATVCDAPPILAAADRWRLPLV